MTNREFYNAVIAGTVTDEMKEFAAQRVAKLDETNAARAEKAAEKAVEKEALRAPIREAIVAAMDTEVAKTASDLIAEAGVEIKPQAIPSLLKALIADGTVVKTTVKITGKGKHVGYLRAEA